MSLVPTLTRVPVAVAKGALGERKISGEMGNNSAGVLNINHPKVAETW